MPQVTVYVRAEDIDKWKAIEKKSLFMHNALNGQVITPEMMKDWKEFDTSGVTKVTWSKSSKAPKDDVARMLDGSPLSDVTKIRRYSPLKDLSEGPVSENIRPVIKSSKDTWQGSNFKKGKNV